ncbi:glycosyltransferase family 4 protein [Acrocarpospora sp. B8E8]|uniref:glycosyltransferase family 4 protein n=1 Tax=Acrocarpospora sp. B8E8 TaxID=3153572 RepID=UPI00325C62D5
MRIVARLHAFPPVHNAGAEMMASAMLSALAERGHDVQVWLSVYNGKRIPYELDGVQIIPAAARLDYATAVKNAAAVISHLENVQSAGALARGWGRPFVVLAHNTFEPTFRAIAGGTTALAVYNSQWMREAAAVWFAANTPKHSPARELVVRPPVHADDYRTAPGDAITLINLYDPKGGGLFWRLAEAIPDRRFLGVLGAYGDQVVKDLPNVEVLQHVPGDRMAELVYARTKVLLMPSVYESWGRTGVEAMASGIPVIAHQTPGLAESLADGGIFVDREDQAGWVAMLRALEDPAEWQAASERALLRSKELDPSEDLARWCEAIEALK